MGLFHKADDFFPIAFQAQARGDTQIGAGQGSGKSLVSAEKLPQITAKGVFVGHGNLQNSVEMAAAFLVNLEILKP